MSADPDPPKPNITDMERLLGEASHFAIHGFAALDMSQQTNDDDNQSDGGDSLFGDSGPNDNTPAGKIKLEEVKREEPPRTQPQKINGPAEEESDDDLMVVDENDLPDHVKARFTANPWTAKIPDLEIVGVKTVGIKKEPRPSPQVIDLDEDPAPPPAAIKHEQPDNDGSLFGDVFGDDDTADVNSGPGSGAAAAAQDNDEAMFVDELFEPAADNVPMDIDNVVKNEGQPQERLNQVADNTDASSRADTARGAGAAQADANRAADVINGTADGGGVPQADANRVAEVYHGTDDGGNTDPTHRANAIHRDDDATGSTPAGSAGPSVSVSSGAVGTSAAGPSGHAGGDEDDAGDDADADADADDGVDGDNGIDGDDDRGEINDSDSDEFHVNDDQELSDGEQPRARRRRAAQKKKAGKRPAREAAASSNASEIAAPTPEDFKFELELVRAELQVYNLRKSKGMLGPGDSDRLKSLNQRCTVLQQALSKSQHSVTEFANEELRKMMEAVDSDNDDPAETQGGAQPEGSKKQYQKSANRIPAMVRRDPNGQVAPKKRKWKPMPKSADARAKKRKTKSGGEVPTTEAILNMVMSQDPIAARARMDDERIFVFDKIDANTVKAQMAKLQEQINADPEADKVRVAADLRKLERARKIFGGRRYCKPENGQWLITGLKKPLHHYQLFGAGWMLSREKHPAGPFGGILADTVGLGKTIEALACILGNRQPDEERSETKLGTLIVVPPNLLAQWQDETDASCPDLRVTRFHSSKHNRVRMSDLLRADIVITSYHEVMKAYPNKDKMKEYDDLPEAQKAEKFQEALGWLFKVEWYRVILDEAHCIKNFNTHTFKACSYLQGKYRWALTATPVHNGLHEIYPYAKFLKDPNAEMFKNVNHKKNEGRRAEVKQLMKAFIEDVLMMREITSLYLGKALFKIPEPHALPNVWIELSEEEFFIYKHVERRIRGMINARLNEDMTAEERKKCKASFFVLAVRLRQAVTHPFLLFLMMRDFFELEDIQLIRQKMEEIRNKYPDRPFINQVGTWCETTLQGRLVGKVTKDSARDGPLGKGNYGTEFNMDTQFEKLEKLKTMGTKICNICSEPLQMPRKTKCSHIFCRECLVSLVEDERNQGSDTVDCPTCEQQHPLDDFMSGDGAQAGSQSQSRRRHTRRPQGWNQGMPGNDYMEYQPMGNEEGAKFLEECDRNVSLALAPSAKTTVVKNIILDWQREHPDDKIIVFTQWVLVGRILGRVLEQESIKFIYYFGEMTREEKEDNVKVFHTVPEVKVMVASLKCGGQGLNLTCANRVILIDPWWNGALEYQGYGRIFRMGQTKETYFVRLLTKKTIDGRMARLQHKKLLEIKEMIKPYDTTRQMPKFQEVIELFGRLQYDDNGKMAVVADYDSDDEDATDDNEAPNDMGPDTSGSGGGGAGVQADGDGHEDGMNGIPGFGDSRVGGYGIQDLV